MIEKCLFLIIISNIIVFLQLFVYMYEKKIYTKKIKSICGQENNQTVQIYK